MKKFRILLLAFSLALSGAAFAKGKDCDCGKSKKKCEHCEKMDKKEKADGAKSTDSDSK